LSAKRTSSRATIPGTMEGELEDIKRLLMLLLYKMGTTQSEISVALQKDRSGVSRMMSTEGIKVIASRNPGNNHA